MNKQEKFSYIYKSKYWRGAEGGSLSGGGSNEQSTSILINELISFIKYLQIHNRICFKSVAIITLLH